MLDAKDPTGLGARKSTNATRPESSATYAVFALLSPLPVPPAPAPSPPATDEKASARAFAPDPSDSVRSCVWVERSQRRRVRSRLTLITCATPEEEEEEEERGARAEMGLKWPFRVVLGGMAVEAAVGDAVAFVDVDGKEGTSRRWMAPSTPPERSRRE